ncbi:MAG: anti-sigma factor domain-containing protein [Sphingobacteriales bacterium]
MKDIKAYIESGILELYVLGDITPAEKLQVEEMASKHPVIKAELEEIERSMELFAEVNAVEPAAPLRDRVLNSLLTNFGDDNNFPTKHPQPVKDNVIALPAPKANSFYKYAFAACLALLIASVVTLFSVYHKLQDANTQLIALNSTNQKFTKTVNFMDRQLNIYRDTSFKVIKLKGTANLPSGLVVVAFSQTKKKVVIDMADLKMPVNDKAHQYQLWALVSGKPVSLGVFDKTDADSTVMKEMKSVDLAQAFAVTREPRGGSVNPTMSEMMVIGTF